MFSRFILTFFLFSACFYNSYASSARISDVSIVDLNTDEFSRNAISSQKEVSWKYLLSDDTVFKIEGVGFEGFEYENSLLIDINGISYSSSTYDTRNSTTTLFFKARNLRDLLLKSNSETFSFKFCVDVGDCTQGFRMRVVDKDMPFNDTYSFFQYYLEDSNIVRAKKSFTSNHTPIVAIIDDGISVQHDDLDGRMWFNDKEINGNGIDDDNNGYIDDYNGWNFVDNNNFMFPKGGHGTNVSGIISANTNNDIGITGISNESRLMPLISCDEGCSKENIIDSINYAVDNGADIINLSLGSQWFAYNLEISEAIKNAKANNVVIVISAGNGDEILTGNGVNTSDYKISPVCNETQSSDIIGVSSLSLYSGLSDNGLRTSWTNYGECTDIYAYGESIATMSLDGGYEMQNGTSFSAPIISGIIALGFNKYGEVDSNLIYDSLMKSKNSLHGVDASMYLNFLGEAIEVNNAKLKEQEEIQQVENKNKALYEKLDAIENDKPGILLVLLPSLKQIQTQDKYKKYESMISVIIDYIESNYL